jgi:hypothetical protein
MVKNKPLITIRRDGKFSVPNIDPSHQCGKIGQTEFNFRVEISVDTLDDRGFCVDNFAIPKAFQRKYAEGRWLASCEMLAGGGIYLMHSLSKGRAKRIMVEISAGRNRMGVFNRAHNRNFPDLNRNNRWHEQVIPFGPIIAAQNAKNAAEIEVWYAAVLAAPVLKGLNPCYPNLK